MSRTRAPFAAPRDTNATRLARRQLRRPLEVIYQNPATIAFWADGTKTVARCSAMDDYDPEVGLLVCIAKHYFGSGSELHRVLGMCGLRPGE